LWRLSKPAGGAREGNGRRKAASANLRELCIPARLQWAEMMGVLFIVMVVVRLIGIASMVAFVLR